MFPDELLSGAEIQAEEVGMDGKSGSGGSGGAAGGGDVAGSTCAGGGGAAWSEDVAEDGVAGGGAAAAVQSYGIFVVVWNAQPVEGVGDYYFGLRADSFAAGGVEFGRIRLEGLALVFL